MRKSLKAYAQIGQEPKPEDSLIKEFLDTATNVCCVIRYVRVHVCLGQMLQCAINNNTVAYRTPFPNRSVLYKNTLIHAKSI